MISNDTQIDLVINKLTRAQYQALSLSGLIDENQLYMITDDPTVPQIVSSMLSSYYLKTETSSAQELNDAFDEKIKIGSYVSGIGYDLSSSNLSVVRISADDYYRMVELSTVDPNVVYILSSDNLNGRGYRAINVGEPVSADDAATKGYVDNAVSSMCGTEIKYDTASGRYYFEI